MTEARPSAPRARARRLAELEEVELRIDQLVAGGDGLGRFEGIPIFVPRSAPGDVVRVQLTERRPDYARAEIIELVIPGADRREPPCPHFATCGGCDLQHLQDDAQSRLKTMAAREVLRRVGGVELADEPELIRGAAWGYRRRTQVHVESSEGRVRVGYHARRSRTLVEVDQCPVLVPELEQALGRLPATLGSSRPSRLDLVAAGGKISTAPPLPEIGTGEVVVTHGGFQYALDARCFFQTHAGLLGDLVDQAVGEGTGATAVDLYAGVGLFSLPLSTRYDQVIAVEGERVAARFARTNARRNRVKNLEIVAQAVESWVKGLATDVDRVMVDPPRSGLGPAVRFHLVERPPKELTYISCHAATLARDLQQLLRVFALERLVFLDLFPQTGHLEAVAQLRRL